MTDVTESSTEESEEEDEDGAVGPSGGATPRAAAAAADWAAQMQIVDFHMREEKVRMDGLVAYS